MIRREMVFLKLALVLIQMVILFMLAPVTKEFIAPLTGDFVINTVTYVILFLLHAYAYQVCVKSRVPKGGHLVSIAAVMFQGSWILYLVATVVLIIEMFSLLTRRGSFNHKVKKVKPPKLNS